jgi:CRP/FNR family transcriptional regulator, cyclic AMP receptor protein
MPRERPQTRIDTGEVDGKSLESVLESHPFIRGLPLACLRMMARYGTFRNLAAGHYLWRQGDRNVEAFLVLEGEIALEIAVPHEGKLSIETVGAGEVAGCTALFHSARWGFDGRAVTLVRTVALNSRDLRAAIECDHEFGYQLLERCTNSLSKRLNASRLKLMEAHSAALP